MGTWGAIHKRLAEIGATPEERREALEEAIGAYQKGFCLKNDYYNGINFAFLLNLRAAQESGDDAFVDRVQARRVRERVLRICEDLLAKGISKGESPRSIVEQKYWVQATIAEALFGLGRSAEAAEAFTKAKQMAPEGWMVESTQEQLGKLAALLHQAAP